MTTIARGKYYSGVLRVLFLCIERHLNAACDAYNMPHMLHNAMLLADVIANFKHWTRIPHVS